MSVFSLPEPLWLCGAAAALSVAGLLAYDLNPFRQRHETATAHGSAAWASRREQRRAGLHAARGLILGRDDRRRLLRLATDRHLLTMAPTRSGKGVSAIIPNLLTWPGAVLVIDPKGENAAVTAGRRRAMGQAVHVLDPWAITDETPASFNPLDVLDPDSPDLGDDAALIADALVHAPAGDGETHWTEEARGLLAGLVLHVATSAPPWQRNLAQVRALLTLPPAEFTTLIGLMGASAAAGGLVARAANALAQKSDRERSGVISSAQANTRFLDSPRLAATLSSSSFALTDLKRQPVSLYLVLPAKRLRTHGRWLRLMVALTLDMMASDAAPPPRPLLFLLDEFAALGHLGAIETAMGLMAGFGVQLWPIVQDLAQLRDLYPARWASFIANAGVIQVFGVNEPGTAEYLSKMLGSRTVTVQGLAASRSHSAQGEGRGGSENYSRVARPLLMPDELRRLPAQQQVLFLQGARPVLATRVLYYSDPAFAGLFAANPFRDRRDGRR
jgi:type IV secretion system protein VirD4